MDITTTHKDTPTLNGPLAGLRVIELASIGPVPFACMLLADMGASILRIGPPNEATLPGFIPQTDDPLSRGRARLVLDLKSPEGIARIKTCIQNADILLEGYRPGVLERLGLAPETLLALNPQLVIGRMTGWGQTGPLAQSVGHDPNYIGLAGVLSLLGPQGQPPTLPLNLVGDYGGGAMLLLAGILAARLNALTTGKGQIVDAAMLDGAAQLLGPIYALKEAGHWRPERADNVFDGGAPFASTYETKDQLYVAVCALEPAFYQALLIGLALDPATLPPQNDHAAWPALKQQFTEIFRTRTRDDWISHFAGTPACVTPVLSLDEALKHPHNIARRVFDEDRPIPAPAPRFSRTTTRRAPQDIGPPEKILAEWTKQSAANGNLTGGSPCA